MDSKVNLEFPKELIGRRVRQYRKEIGLTVEELAKKAGVSQSMISQIERGQTNPSLDTLWKLSYFLEVPVFSFFKNIAPMEVQVTKRKDQKVMTMLHPNVTYRLISPTLDRRFELFELIVQPGEVAHLPQLSHQGEEIGFITKGELELIIEDKAYFLETGDSIYFDSKMKHKFRNPGDTDAIGIWLMIPPDPHT